MLEYTAFIYISKYLLFSHDMDKDMAHFDPIVSKKGTFWSFLTYLDMSCASIKTIQEFDFTIPDII